MDTDLLPSLPSIVSVGSTLVSQSPDKVRHGQQRADGPVVEAGGGLPAGGASHWPPGLWPGCAPLRDSWTFPLCLLTGREGPECTMQGSAGPAPSQTPPLQVNSALVKVVSFADRRFFPLNPTGYGRKLGGKEARGLGRAQDFGSVWPGRLPPHP